MLAIDTLVKVYVALPVFAHIAFTSFAFVCHLTADAVGIFIFLGVNTIKNCLMTGRRHFIP